MGDLTAYLPCPRPIPPHTKHPLSRAQAGRNALSLAAGEGHLSVVDYLISTAGSELLGGTTKVSTGGRLGRQRGGLGRTPPNAAPHT